MTYDLSSTFFGQHFLVGQTFFLNIFLVGQTFLLKHFLVGQTFFGEGKEIYMKIYLLICSGARGSVRAPYIIFGNFLLTAVLRYWLHIILEHIILETFLLTAVLRYWLHIIFWKLFTNCSFTILVVYIFWKLFTSCMKLISKAALAIRKRPAAIVWSSRALRFEK